MVPKSYKVTVPGSLMLFGEHAVLRNHRALVGAVDRKLTMSLIPKEDNRVRIVSQLGTLETTLDDIGMEKPFAFVMTAIDHYRVHCERGFTLTIDSEFSENLGFGSSAAVTVGTLALLHQVSHQGAKIDPYELCKLGRKIVHKVQGLGSGADVAASVFGGIVAYQIEPYTIKRLEKIIPLVAIYSGNKRATKDVVLNVKRREQALPAIVSSLFKTMHNCAVEAKMAIEQGSLSRLGKIMRFHQGCQMALGVSNTVLDELINALRAQKGILGAKISGSGLGDCIIGLGELEGNIFPRNSEEKDRGVLQIPLRISQEGLTYVEADLHS